MHNPPEFMRSEQRLHPRPVREVQPMKRKLFMLPQVGKTGVFQRRIVIRIQVVQPDNPATVRQQRRSHRVADKTGHSRNQNRRFGALQEGGALRFFGQAGQNFLV